MSRLETDTIDLVSNPSSRKKIAFLTSKDLPSCTEDDLLAGKFLNILGYDLVPVIWDETSVLELNRFAAVVIRSPWDYQYKKEQFLKFIESLSNLQMPVLNSPKLMLWNMDKAYLFELEKKNISIIPSLKIPQNQSGDYWKSQITDCPWDKIVIKPTVSASAYNTFLVSKEDAIKRIHQWEGLSHKVDFLIQEFCQEIQTFGEASLLFFNNGQKTIYSHAVLKKPKTEDFRVQPHLGGQTESWDAESTAIAFAESILSHLKERWLYARVDILKHHGKWVLGELEVLEPQLFLKFDSSASQKFSSALVSQIETNR